MESEVDGEEPGGAFADRHLGQLGELAVAVSERRQPGLAVSAVRNPTSGKKEGPDPRESDCIPSDCKRENQHPTRRACYTARVGWSRA